MAPGGRASSETNTNDSGKRVEAMADIVHLPFIGTAYKTGIRGRKIAIVGYSHYYDDLKQDSENFTRECIQKTVDKVWKPRFFSSIRNAFSHTDDGLFWNSVIFFNYVPTMIGTGADKFGRIADTSVMAANARFFQILDQFHPDLIFIFTKKVALASLGLEFVPMHAPMSNFLFARRQSENGEQRIYRLRHTQGAKKADLRAAIETAWTQG
jgi:hypothetical protein